MNALASRRWMFVLVAALAVSSTGCEGGLKGDIEVTYTVGDLVSVHDEVRIDDTLVDGQVRLSEGQVVHTSAQGRARLVLDSGATIALDGDTSLALSDGKLMVKTGRVFIHTEEIPLSVHWGRAQAKVAKSSVALDLSTKDTSKTYCATGEITVIGVSGQHRVEAGESATIRGEEVRVLPEKAFEDWTGGLAAPVISEIEGKSAIPHVRARNGNGDAGSPLVVRSHQVDTKIVGEVAVTRGSTTYFNGSDISGEAHVRLAIPEGAMVTEVSLQVGKDGPVQRAHQGIAAGPSRTPGASAHGLEWAGSGWLQGTVAHVPAGEILRLNITYVNWLDIEGGRAAYRYPLSTDSSVPPVAELAMRIDAQETLTKELSVSAGAEVKRRTVTYRAADVRPQGDFVVELRPQVIKEDGARAYVQRTGAQKKDAYILVRTELPPLPRAGVTLAIVVDTSLSVGASTLETSLAVVDTLVQSLGPKDSVVVVASDETARSIGPKVPTPVTDGLRKQLATELSRLRAGGASNLERGLQFGADLVDASDQGDAKRQGMVVYIGDGSPTVGSPDADSIRDLLQARPGGMPRLGAVAVGPMPNRWLLARLARGAGVVVEVQDRADAARAGAVLLGEAMTPRYRDVKVDLGPHVDRIYPRRPQVVTAGTTVSVIGRLRGPVPEKIVLTYREGGEEKTLDRRLARVKMPPSADLERDWALARVEQIASEGEGIEPAITLASQSGLLTPWTGYFFSPPSEGMGTAPFSHRILELSLDRDVSYSRQLDPPMSSGSSLIEPDSGGEESSSLVEAAQAAMHRLLGRAARSIRACRDARAAVNPQIADTFRLSISIDGNGVTTRVLVRQVGIGKTDLVLERCIEGVVRSLPYVPIGTSVAVEHEITLEGHRTLRPTKCSEASKVSRPVRREIWRSRNPSTSEDYRAAAQMCELRRWADRQEFLLLMMENASDALSLARELDLSGEEDAAEFVRHQALRSVRTFEELQRMMRVLRADEPSIRDELEKALEKEKEPQKGLELCRKFLRLAPHSTYARRRLLALLEVLDMEEQIISSVRSWRSEPVADAGLLAEGASALLRLGKKDEGRRAFGELIERAPRDPWTLAFVGDRLRAEGLYDEAGAAYDTLARMMPHEGAVILRQALAHAGAGRIDVASRLLDRVSQTGGRHDEGRLADLATIAEVAILAAARGGDDDGVEAEIERRLLRTPLPDAQALVLVRAAPADEPVTLEISREEGETLAQSAEMDARHLGLMAARVERGERGPVKLALRRAKVAGPSHPVEATVSVLLLGKPGELPRLSSKTVRVAADGEPLEIEMAEGRLL